MSVNSKAVKLHNSEWKEDEERAAEEEEQQKAAAVTRELQINGGGRMEMDRQLILKRIRQRKRINNLRAILQSLVSSPFSRTRSKPNTTPPTNSSLPDPFTFFYSPS